MHQEKKNLASSCLAENLLDLTDVGMSLPREFSVRPVSQVKVNVSQRPHNELTTDGLSP